MAAVLVPVALLVLAIVLIVLAIVHETRNERAHTDELRDSDNALHYPVPEGQDPAVVVAALRAEGYDAAPDATGGGGAPEVLIRGGANGAPDREEIRAALARVDQINVEGDGSQGLPPVHFTDE